MLGTVKKDIETISSHIQYWNSDDNTVLKAIEVLEKGEAFPKAPEKIEN